MECGFYVASEGFDITSNCQRRERVLSSREVGDTDSLKSLDARYMWNYNLYKQLRLQKIPSHWMIPMI